MLDNIFMQDSDAKHFVKLTIAHLAKKSKRFQRHQINDMAPNFSRY